MVLAGLLLAILGGPTRAAVLHGVELPRGSRSVADTDNFFTSSRGFRQTVQFYQRLLDRSGVAHQALPAYRYRSVVLARFLSRDPATPWLAIHVFQRRGVTHIYVVPRSLLTPDEPRGKEPTR